MYTYNVCYSEEVVDEQQVRPPVFLTVEDCILSYKPEDSSLDDREQSNGQAHDEEMERLNPGHMRNFIAWRRIEIELIESDRHQTNLLYLLKRKWATSLELRVFSDLWMEFSRDLALRRPLTQPNTNGDEIIKKYIYGIYKHHHCFLGAQGLENKWIFSCLSS